MTRPGSYILELQHAKVNLKMQIMHCQKSLECIQNILDDPNYSDSATTLEKSNFDTLMPLISNGLIVLQSIVWE